MVVRVLDATTTCYTYDDGLKVAALIRSELIVGTSVVVSFSGVDAVPSSFINGALASLLDAYSYDYLRKAVRIANVRPQVADMIKRCMAPPANAPVAA